MVKKQIWFSCIFIWYNKMLFLYQYWGSFVRYANLPQNMDISIVIRLQKSCNTRNSNKITMPITLTNCTNIHFGENMNIFIYVQFFCLVHSLKYDCMVVIYIQYMYKEKRCNKIGPPKWKYPLLHLYWNPIPGVRRTPADGTQ